MVAVLRNTWPLLLGVLMLMIGNGLQGTLLGIRGDIEGFSTLEISIVMSGYAIGFLGGSTLTPLLIQRVGHVRVFAALGSFISAIFVLFPVFPNPLAWTLLRIGIGLCFSGVYVVAESWLNNNTENETRGQALSIYLIMSMSGIVAAQAIFIYGDPAGFGLFVFASVMVSLSFAPILLAISPTPSFEISSPMGFQALFKKSPFGCIAILFVGGLLAVLFSMTAVYGVKMGYSVKQISALVASIYVGAMVFQYPIGYYSDRLDRRSMIIFILFSAAVMALLGTIFSDNFYIILGVLCVIGGILNPCYGIIIAYVNDYLEYENMSSAAGGLIFINGMGAIFGPLILGQMMSNLGPVGFFVFLSVFSTLIALYGVYRTTQRRFAPETDESSGYIPVLPTASPVAVDTAVGIAIEAAQSEDESQNIAAQKAPEN